MSLAVKQHTEVQIKSPADKFFSAYKAKACIPQKISDGAMDGAEGHGERFESSGLIMQFSYNLDGKVQTIKGKAEVDEGSKRVTATVLEGDALTRYKSFKVTVQVTQRGEGSLVKWNWDYEKVGDDVPDPKKLQDLAVKLTKDVDTYISSSA